MMIMKIVNIEWATNIKRLILSAIILLGMSCSSMAGWLRVYNGETYHYVSIRKIASIIITEESITVCFEERNEIKIREYSKKAFSITLVDDAFLKSALED